MWKATSSMAAWTVDLDLRIDAWILMQRLWMLEIKAMYAFIVKTNSRFYAGGKFAYGQYNAGIDRLRALH
ncbi:MAG: hypothetical protein MZV70_32555 [Desulfobacterales bacterium]|nr:hypothetical protein [Desulfobacterales bacterium]